MVGLTGAKLCHELRLCHGHVPISRNLPRVHWRGRRIPYRGKSKWVEGPHVQLLRISLVFCRKPLEFRVRPVCSTYVVWERGPQVNLAMCLIYEASTRLRFSIMQVGSSVSMLWMPWSTLTLPRCLWLQFTCFRVFGCLQLPLRRR